MKLIIFDVDNTIIKGQSQRLLLRYLYDTKRVNFYYYASVLIWFVAYKLQIVKDPRKIISLAYSFLKGKSVIEIDAMTSDFFENVLRKNVFPEALYMIHKIEQDNSYEKEIILVSNAPLFIIKPLANLLNIRTFFCTQLEVINNIYTGKVLGDIMYGDNKKTAVSAFVVENRYELSSTVAYGDHISDLPILNMVGHPVAINPSSKLRKIANDKGWEIHNWNI